MNNKNDLIDFIKNEDWEIETPSGWQSFKGLCKYKKKQLYVITTESLKTITVTSNHCFIDERQNKIFCKDSLNKKILTKDGLEKVISIVKSKKDFVYDLASVSNGSTFYANSILNHNTHLIEEFWSSVIPTVSSGKKSKILVVSTPKGVGNKFYDIYTGAESGKLKTWVPQRIDWWDFPGRDEAWKQSQIELLGSEEKFHQEFDNTFLDDAAAAVGASVLQRFKSEKKEPIWVSDDKEYMVFEYPNKDRLYVVGVDVGEGIGRASSVAQVLDVTNLQDIRQVAVYGSSRIEPYHFATKLNVIGQSWGLPPMLIERNNCGAQVIDALYYNHKYEKIASYSKVSTQDRYNTTGGMGVKSHTNIKSDGIQNMRYWVNHLQTVMINDPTTISEFETFIRFPNGVFKKKSELYYDDRVMALVWALFVLETELCQQYFEIVERDMQDRPQQIADNGMWEKIPEFYQLKELTQYASIVPKPHKDEDEVYPSLGITNKMLEEADKYDSDIDDLISMGYTFL
jgi:hypothetical protein